MSFFFSYHDHRLYSPLYVCNLRRIECRAVHSKRSRHKHTSTHVNSNPRPLRADRSQESGLRSPSRVWPPCCVDPPLLDEHGDMIYPKTASSRSQAYPRPPVCQNYRTASIPTYPKEMVVTHCEASKARACIWVLVALPGFFIFISIHSPLRCLSGRYVAITAPSLPRIGGGGTH